MVRYLFYTIGDLTYQSPLVLRNINILGKNIIMEFVLKSLLLCILI